jgi:hypothetical protein
VFRNLQYHLCGFVIFCYSPVVPQLSIVTSDTLTYVYIVITLQQHQDIKKFSAGLSPGEVPTFLTDTGIWGITLPWKI